MDLDPSALADGDAGAGADPVHADANMSNAAPRTAVHAPLRPGTANGAVPPAGAVLLVLIGFPELSLAVEGNR
ncbi:hypothetical protein AB0323_07455 [Arthrobacter sp. NPDC080031]|uniref:hypothetical protein n=1 Tax=Arthrobacter sp. NPDC080031 TaxID=3155918 RepID=UPI00344B6504